MEITDIRVRKVDNQGKLKAYVTVTFDACFVVHNVKVIEGADRVFIAMPSRKTKNGEFKDVAHPITSEFRNVLQDRIVGAYEAEEDPVPRSEGVDATGDAADSRTQTGSGDDVHA
ncbi:MAG: septation regulator SpoVG [Spirochaetota bacterium]